MIITSSSFSKLSDLVWPAGHNLAMASPWKTFSITYGYSWQAGGGSRDGVGLGCLTIPGQLRGHLTYRKPISKSRTALDLAKRKLLAFSARGLSTLRTQGSGRRWLQQTRLLATGPPGQATGQPRSGAGVGVGMVRGAGDSLT